MEVGTSRFYISTVPILFTFSFMFPHFVCHALTLHLSIGAQKPEQLFGLDESRRHLTNYTPISLSTTIICISYFTFHTHTHTHKHLYLHIYIYLICKKNIQKIIIVVYVAFILLFLLTHKKNI